MTTRLREEGAIAVVVAVFSVMAFGFAAIVVDLGYARSLKARAQDAADSAALAGAAALFKNGPLPDFAGARDAAHDNAEEVLGSAAAWGGCTDASALPAEVAECVSFDSLTDPRQVRVRVPNTSVDSFFGGVFGYGGTAVSAAAIASLGPVEFTPECAICVLDAGPHVLSGVEIRAEAADISFNGDVELVNGSTVIAEGRTVFLGGDPIGAAADFADALVTGAAPINDPLGGEPEPPDPPPLVPPVPPALPPPPPRIDPCNPDPVIGGPGIYSGLVELSGTCNLADGTYVITGDLTATVGASIVGDDVQLWLVGGSIDFSAADLVDLEAPDDDVSLIYAPTGSPEVSIFGASSSIVGHINAPGGSIAGGTSCDVDGLIVVAELDVATGQCLVSTEPTTRITAPTEPPVLIR